MGYISSKLERAIKKASPIYARRNTDDISGHANVNYSIGIGRFVDITCLRGARLLIKKGTVHNYVYMRVTNT